MIGILYASTTLPKDLTSAVNAVVSFERLEQAVKALLDNVPSPETSPETNEALSSGIQADEQAQEGTKAAAPRVVPKVLWRMQYLQTTSSLPQKPLDPPSGSDGVITLQSLPQDLVFDDRVLDDVKAAWNAILGVDKEADEANEEFMVFEAREGVAFGEDD